MDPSTPENLQSKEKLLKLIKLLSSFSSSNSIIIPKNYHKLFRKMYKYLKANRSKLVVNFNELEELDSQKQSLLGIDSTWINIRILFKEWIFDMISACFHSLNMKEVINPQMEIYLLNCFNIIKEVCQHPPKELIKFPNEENLVDPKAQVTESNGNETGIHILYVLLNYLIILDEKEVFPKIFTRLIFLAENSPISYKFYVLILKFCAKYFPYLKSFNVEISKSQNSIDRNLIREFINPEFIPIEKDDFIFPVIEPESSLCSSILKQFNELTVNFLKTNMKKVNKERQSKGLLSFLFSKTNVSLPKELDGSNKIDFFTILNVCEEYSLSYLNNTAAFSGSHQLMKLILENIKDGYIPDSVKDLKVVLHSYCIRIFDQGENYLESYKNQISINKITDFNRKYIEASVWESIKILHIICKMEPSIVNKINMRMKQVYERIAMKQSGIVFLEILQFFIDNSKFIIVDIDYYVSEFFKLKLKYNYKNEILVFTTLEFLFKNREILTEKTQIFTTCFPSIIKLFAIFPKFLNKKFSKLMEYITKPVIISELFIYILELPSIILIIENLDSYKRASSLVDLSQPKPKISELLNGEYVKSIEYLLRDVSNDQEGYGYTEQNYLLLKSLYENFVFTAKVNSTYKIVPMLLDKFFDVILDKEEIESAIEIILIIFERLLFIHGDWSFQQEIRNLLIKKIEQIFTRWPKVVSNLNAQILYQIRKNYSNLPRRELICLLSWSLGEFLERENEEESCLEDEEILETFACLEKLLRDNIKFFQSNKRESNPKYEDSVDGMVKWYSTYFEDKTTTEEILNERLLTIIIGALGKLSVKFKSFVSRIKKCFIEINVGLNNNSLSDRLFEVLVSLDNISISSEYLV